MTRRINEPATVLALYGQGFRTFLPQAHLEHFRHLVTNAIEEQRRELRGHLGSSRHRSSEGDNSWEAFKDRAYTEARIEELDEFERLADELATMGLYRFIEIERKRVLVQHFGSQDPKRLSDIHYLDKAFPFLRSCFGANEIDELRLICNCIKHSGRVSAGLAHCHPTWHQGEVLPPLKDALGRIAPFVGPYWVDLLHRSRQVSRTRNRGEPQPSRPG